MTWLLFGFLTLTLSMNHECQHSLPFAQLVQFKETEPQWGQDPEMVPTLDAIEMQRSH